MSAAKTRPPRRNSGTLLRARLVDALSANIERKLQLLVAPAGFGKTTLLVDFARDTNAVTCWTTLDAADRDVSSFLESVIAAIQLRLPGFGEQTLAALRTLSDIESRAPYLARLLAAEVDEQIDQLTVLVLDDYHEVNESAPVTQLLDELLRVLPDTLRIMLSSRTLPALTVSRLIVANELFGLGEADLRFTVTELLTLLQRHGDVLVDHQQMRALAEGAEGWIAGFLLSVPRLWEGLVGGLIAARGSEGPLYDYLATQAFDRQPPELQRFLLATSVLQTADSELCNQLLGSGNWPALVAEAERAGLFVTRLPGRGGEFRYHQLFRDFLQSRLRRTEPEEFRRLQAAAATLLEGRGLWPEALSHLALAERHEAAAALVTRILPELERRSRWRTLVDVVTSLPAGTLDRHPRLVLSGSRAALLVRDLARAEELAERARALGTQSFEANVQANGLALLGNIRRMQGRTLEALETLDAAQTLTPQDDELIAIVRRERGKCLGVQGEFAAAVVDFRAALAYFERIDAVEEAARTEFGLAVALAKSGRLGEAIAHYESALALSRQAEDAGLEAELLNSLGCAYAYQGDYARAQSLLQDCLALVQETGRTVIEGATLHSLGEVLLAGGDNRGARAMFERGLAQMQEAGELWVVTHLYDALALACAFEGNLAQAEAHSHHALTLARRQDSPYLIALCSLTLGALQSRLGDPEGPATLQPAADLFREMGARREAARGQLWLMQAKHAVGEPAAAREHLREALRLTAALGSDALLDLHVRWDPAPFLAAGSEEAGRVAQSFARTRIQLPARQEIALVPLPEFGARAFGPGLLVDESDREIDWVWGKARELFFLLLHSGPQRKEQLLDALWPESSPEKALTALHTAAYRMRRASHPQILQLHGGVYRVNIELVTAYDVREFERLLGEAATGGDEAIPVLRRAVSLYGAPFLDGLKSDWCAAERRRLESRFLAALERLSDRCAAAGLIEESIAAAERLLVHDPLREDIYARVIRSYLRLGDRVAAHRQFEQCVSLLWDELGVGPGDELQTLGRRITAA